MKVSYTTTELAQTCISGDQEVICLDLAKISMTSHARSNMTPLLGYPKFFLP
jgi:hypothetical protein